MQTQKELHWKVQVGLHGFGSSELLQCVIWRSPLSQSPEKVRPSQATAACVRQDQVENALLTEGQEH